MESGVLELILYTRLPPLRRWRLLQGSKDANDDSFLKAAGHTSCSERIAVQHQMRTPRQQLPNQTKGEVPLIPACCRLTCTTSIRSTAKSRSPCTFSRPVK